MDLHERIAELESKLDAMSHECGMMLGLLNDIRHYHEECTHDDQMHALIPLEYVSAINGFVERDVDGENPCPLTDAFLLSVRAEGVDLLASEAGQMAQVFKQGSADWKRWKSIVFFAVHFAAQLRNGEHVGEEGNGR
ncbi:MAG: hypothetical protein PW844_19025 [Pantoea sp.]|uniref:hypothetical protein n=1 Tax=Pantoea sp. TaxID=69393 RepID=UPI00238F8B93|nr:hypothetical protein [Pantoea sp.]MDE1188542.1 hypothetical protein [Pantoea sp.]